MPRLDTQEPRHVTAAFYALLTAVALALGALIWRQLGYGLEYDEAYLLFVIRSLAAGEGFIDDGISFGSSGMPFDPNISTGPTVLLPSALAWGATNGSLPLARLIPITFFVVLLVATAWLFHRAGGRWVALSAVSGYLLMSTASPDLQNASLMPGRFVGELPATALLVASSALLVRRSYLSAGLLAGMAILAKLIFVLPVTALLVVWGMAAWRKDRSEFRRFVPTFALALVVPLAAFEVFKALTLGFEGYRRSVELTGAFGAGQSLPPPAIIPSIPGKFDALLALTTPAAAVMVVLSMTGILLIRILLPQCEREEPRASAEATQRSWLSVVGLLAGAGSLLVWWLLRSQQMSARPVVPAVLLVLACASGSAMYSAIRLRKVRTSEGAAAIAPAVVYVVLLAAVVSQAIRIVTDDSGARLMAEQTQAASILSHVASELPTDGFWTNPEFRILTSLPQEPRGLGPTTNPGLEVYTSVRAHILTGYGDARIYEDTCETVLYSSSNVLVCFGKDSRSS